MFAHFPITLVAVESYLYLSAQNKPEAFTNEKETPQSSTKINDIFKKNKEVHYNIKHSQADNGC